MITNDPVLHKLIVSAQSGDAGSMEKLVNRFDPLCKGLSKRNTIGFEYEDRVGISRLALINAILRYDSNECNIEITPYLCVRINDALIQSHRDGRKQFVGAVRSNNPTLICRVSPEVFNSLTANRGKNDYYECEDNAILEYIDKKCTGSERKVFRLMIEGYCPKEIATKLNLAPAYIWNIRTRIKKIYNEATKIRTSVP